MEQRSNYDIQINEYVTKLKSQTEIISIKEEEVSEWSTKYASLYNAYEDIYTMYNKLKSDSESSFKVTKEY